MVLKKDVDKLDILYLAGGSTMWDNHFGKQGDSFLRSEVYTYQVILSFHSYVFTQDK